MPKRRLRQRKNGGTTEDRMKITTDYIVGNTAIQIVNTGKRIKVIDIAHIF